MIKSTIPSWIGTALLSMEPAMRWNPEKQALAEKLERSLRGKAEFHCWPKETVDKVFYVNPHDEFAMYSQKDKKKEK